MREILLNVLVVPPFTGAQTKARWKSRHTGSLCRELLWPDQNNHDGPRTKNNEQNVEKETIIKKGGALLVVHTVTNR